MGRAAYCREQAALCREVAAQLSLHTDVERLRERARAYDVEADRIDAVSHASAAHDDETSSDP